MAPLPIPLGPLGGFAGNKNLIFFICIFGSYKCTLCIITNFLYAHIFFNKNLRIYVSRRAWKNIYHGR